MNKVFKVIWSEARNAYVVVSEIAKNMGSKSCSTKKLLAMLLATGVMTCAGVEAGAPQYNEKATNTSGLEAYNQVSGFTNSNAVGLRVEQKTANGGKYVIAGVSNMGTYTEGGKILLYQKESAGNVYEGEVLTAADRKYVYTATYDKENNKWTYNTQYQVKENGKWVDSDKGTIRTSIQGEVHPPKNLEYKSVVSKETNGYFQMDTVTTTDSVTGKADVTPSEWQQTGDVVTAKVSADKQLTVSVNGKETKLTQAVVYVDDNKDKSLKSTNATSVGDDAIALGKETQATNNSVAIGYKATIAALDGVDEYGEPRQANNSVAIGYQSKVTESGAVAIGQEANASAYQSTALGANAKAKGEYSTALGHSSEATGERSIALGDNARAYKEKSVALGAGSIANREAGEVGYDADSEDTTSLTWKANAGAVSVGYTLKPNENASFEQITRQITNVAAGSEDTDAVNVAQLKKAKTEVAAGTNVTVSSSKGANGQDIYTISAVDTTYSAGNGIAIDSDKNNAISVKLNDGENNLVVDQKGLSLKKALKVESVNAGSTSISNDGLKIGEKTYVSSSGLNANGQKVTNVAAGEADTDAVNVSQLNATNEQVINNSNRISRLGDRVNKVGAGAAALAALHPMDFDPDDKWSFAAGYGNYAGENAAAVGAYYRPDEKVMFSVGGTVGNGENMVNAGISFALDRTNRVSNSRTAMAREIVDLRGQLTQVTAELASLKATLGVIDETKTKLFPDVPANHWAYEYISKLAGNGYVEGYPDGNFDGNRLMTRYEFAAMLYRAMEKGAALEERIINEFAPELGRIRVDRISGKDGDRSKIERVRVNGPRSERDHYGSKLK